MNKKSTVGIITFHCADNFGAVLQAHALQSVIENLLFKVEIIDFQPHALTSQYKFYFNIKYVINNYGLSCSLRKILGRVRNFNYIRQRNKYFNDFRNRYLKLSHKIYYSYSDLEHSSNTYDYYITGSDQVWNFEFDDNTNDAFFLKFAPKDSAKLSYAASTGKKIDELTKKVLINNLNDFKDVSVREKSAYEVLKEYINVNVCLDPTLLLNKEHYVHKLNLKEDRNKFIFVYDLEYNVELIELVNRISKDLNLKVICYSKNNQSYNNVYDYISNKGPEQFLNCIYNANIVITNSFHGTCFSLIFNKNFYCFPHKTKGERMIDLLGALNLEDRIIYKANQIDNFNSEIDYDKVNESLETERIKSINFLKKALNIN